MSRLLSARSGCALPLSNRPLRVRPSLTTALPTSLFLLPSFSSPLPQSTQIRTKISWSEWLTCVPTSSEEMQTVYKACDESRIFAPTPQRPIETLTTSMTKRIEPRAEVVESSFRQTPGLQPSDWAARGLSLAHAVEVATRMHAERLFAHTKKAKKIVGNHWSVLWREAQAQKDFEEARRAVLQGDMARIRALRATKAERRVGNYWPVPWREAQTQKDIEEARRAVLQGDMARIRALRATKAEKGEEPQEFRQTIAARQKLRARKRAEQASDAEEGIKSKRRPLRLDAQAGGVPLRFQGAEQLRRLEREKRKIVVDKAIRKRTKQKDKADKRGEKRKRRSR